MKQNKRTHLILKICCFLLFAIFNGCSWNNSDTYDPIPVKNHSNQNITFPGS